MSSTTRRMGALALVLPALALVAGCGSDSNDDATTAAAPATETTAPDNGGGATAAATVGMTEYAFDPADLTVKKGDTVEVDNNGAIVHNWTVVDTQIASSTLSAGDTDEVTVDLPPGSYDYICTIGSHADLGMKGTLTVK